MTILMQAHPHSSNSLKMIKFQPHHQFESMLAVTHCKTFYQHLIPLLNNVRTNLDRYQASWLLPL